MKNLKDIREAYGLTKRDMSRICGFGLGMWGLYESGAIPNKSNQKIIQIACTPDGMLSLLSLAPFCVQQKLGKRFSIAISNAYDMVSEIEQDVIDYRKKLNEGYFKAKLAKTEE